MLVGQYVMVRPRGQTEHTGGGGRTQYMGDKRLCYVGKCFSSAVGSLSSSVVSVLVTVHHCGTGLALL